jgi:uncharacterized protein
VIHELANARNASLAEQVDVLERLLLSSTSVVATLVAIRDAELRDAYLGAGAIAGTVWNALHDFELHTGIRDFDVVYFDSEHLDEKAEAATATKLRFALNDLEMKIDVKNQARVHIWYPSRFGKEIPPYKSAAHAIASWPSTASCIGVRFNAAGTLDVCSPYGLHDLLSLVVRPNKLIVPEPVYSEKCQRWTQQWPLLKIIPW